jgi:DNA-binding GntR family transcriptional regulator
LNNIPRFDAAEIATKLNIRRRETVIWFLRLRAAKGMPLALQWAVVPARVVSNVGYDDLHPGGLTKLYQETYGIRRAFADAHYAPTLASRDEARNLKVDRDSPLIEERRISYFFPSRRAHPSGADMVPYEYLLSLYTDRVSLDFSWYDG